MAKQAYFDQMTYQEMLTKEMQGEKPVFIEIHRLIKPVEAKSPNDLKTTGSLIPVTHTSNSENIPSSAELIGENTELFGTYSVLSVWEELGHSKGDILESITKGKLPRVQKNYTQRYGAEAL